MYISSGAVASTSASAPLWGSYTEEVRSSSLLLRLEGIYKEQDLPSGPHFDCHFSKNGVLFDCHKQTLLRHRDKLHTQRRRSNFDLDQVPASSLKSILHSKRANIYYLEHCRVLVNGGRVEYLTERQNQSQYWNIPIANTTTVLLGTGTSITQAAMREFAKAGVLVGFCGGGGTPLLTANEVDVEVAWFCPQTEYRPTEYLQAWVSFWFNDTARLSAAKSFQLKRLDLVLKHWTKNRLFRDAAFEINEQDLARLLDVSRFSVKEAADTTALLTEEARMTKELFKMAAIACNYGTFKRDKRGSGT